MISINDEIRKVEKEIESPFLFHLWQRKMELLFKVQILKEVKELIESKETEFPDDDGSPFSISVEDFKKEILGDEK